MRGEYRWHLFLLSATIALIFLSVFSFWSKVTFFSKSFPHVDKSVSKLTLRRTVSLEIFCISENIVAFMVCRGQCFQQVLLFPLNSCMWIVCRTMARNNLNLWILIAIFNEELGWKKKKNQLCQMFLAVLLTSSIPIHAQNSLWLWCRRRRGLIMSSLMRWMEETSYFTFQRTRTQGQWDCNLSAGKYSPANCTACNTGDFYLKG